MENIGERNAGKDRYSGAASEKLLSERDGKCRFVPSRVVLSSISH